MPVSSAVLYSLQSTWFYVVRTRVIRICVCGLSYSNVFTAGDEIRDYVNHFLSLKNPSLKLSGTKKIYRTCQRASTLSFRSHSKIKLLLKLTHDYKLLSWLDELAFHVYRRYQKMFILQSDNMNI